MLVFRLVFHLSSYILPNIICITDFIFYTVSGVCSKEKYLKFLNAISCVSTMVTSKLPKQENVLDILND